MRGFVRALVVLAVLGAVGWFAAQAWLSRAMNEPGPNQDVVRIHLPPGASVRSVLQTLEREGVLRDARAIEAQLRLNRQSFTPRAGNYDIAAHATPRQILDQLIEGRVVLEQLTIPEGWTFAEMRRAIAAHPKIKQTLKGRTAEEIMSALGQPGQHPEGRFFPDTYRFADGATDLEILRLAHGQMQRELDAAWAARAKGLPLKSPEEALILASIVEKETGLESERPQIAGVFTTRLRKGMRLQTDPTVIYGLGEKFDGDLRRRDMTTDTPYNTYTREGLPPTPIALPGRGSLVAAVNPDETGAIFFVATGAGDGAHVFSRTLEEHNAALARYLARLRANPPGDRK